MERGFESGGNRVARKMSRRRNMARVMTSAVETNCGCRVVKYGC